MKLLNKSVLITGAAGGIGSAVAKMCAEEGASVYLLDLDGEKGKELEISLKNSGYSVKFIKVDVTSEEDWKQAAETVLQENERIDVLVNNAGINIRHDIDEMTVVEWDKMMKVNIGSVFLGIKTVLPHMRLQQSGSIVNMSSVCGLVGHKYTNEAYTASKGAITLLTKSVAVRNAKYGVRVNSVHPSTVNTPFVQKVFKDPKKKQERLDEVPLGRLASVDDVAKSILFLASSDSEFLNGVSLPVDGGVTAY